MSLVQSLSVGVALTLLSVSVAHASELPDIPFEKYQLKNGLTVILHHDDRLPLTAVSVWYDVGAYDEPKGRSGFAHLFEHMMFQGSEHVGEDKFFAYLQQAGATGTNGTTSFDRTNYFETVPSNELELALWLESDRMGYLLPALTEKSLSGQINVVKNERRQSVDNAPYGKMEELITQTIYPPSHPYYGNVIGSMEDLSKASVDDVKDFFKTFYSPANATLTIAGDYDPKTIKALVEKYFGTIQGRPKPKKREIPVPTIEKEQVIRFDEPVATLPKISMVWMAPSTFKEGTATLDLLAHVISGTKSARLDRRVSYEDHLAQSVTAYLSENRSGSEFQIDLVVRPGRTLEEARKAIDEVLASIEKNPPTEAELKRAVNAQESRLIRGLELLGSFSGRAERLQLYNNFLGDPGKLGWDLKRYRDTTKEDLLEAYKTYLKKPRLIVYAIPAAQKQPKKGDQS